MEDRSDSEKEFIESVWSKIRYLEYKRNADEKIFEMHRNYNKKRIKAAAWFGVHPVKRTMKK